MMVATATLATAESLSPETKPRRPTSLTLAAPRQSRHHQHQQAANSSAPKTSTNDKSNRQQQFHYRHSTTSSSRLANSNKNPVFSSTIATMNVDSSSSSSSSSAKENGTSFNRSRPAYSSFNNPSSVSSDGFSGTTATANSRPKIRHNEAKNNMHTKTSNFTSINAAVAKVTAQGGSTKIPTANKNDNGDEGLEYASVTYRYLKNMEKQSSRVPSYARSMSCLTEQKQAAAGIDESIVSIPCPSQPVSECPTPSSVASKSLRRRHSDLNLSSISTFLRTRFSRQDDTVAPKPGDSDEEFLRNLAKAKQQQLQRQKEKTSTPLVGNAKTSMMTHGKQPCSQSCSNHVNSNWRRPCFRCKHHFIEAILEADATEV